MDTEWLPQAGPEDAATLVAALAPLDRQVLVVLAALGEPVNRSKLASQLQLIDLRHPPAKATDKVRRALQAGRAVAASDLSPVLVRLRGQGLVESEPGGGGLWLCRPVAAHAALSEPSNAAALALLASALDRPNGRERWYVDYAAEHLRQIRQARLAFYAGKQERGVELLAAAEQNAKRAQLDAEPLLRLFPARTPIAALQLLPVAQRIAYVRARLLAGFEAPMVCEPALLELAIRTDSEPGGDLRPLALMQSALAGTDAAQLEAVLNGDRSALALEALAVCALRRGAFDEARALAASAFDQARGPKSTRKPRLSGPLAPLLALALATGRREHAAVAAEQYKWVKRGQYVPVSYLGVALLLQGDSFSTAQLLPDDVDVLDGLGVMLAAAFGAGVSGPFEELGERLRERLALGGAHWLAAQADSLRRALRKRPEPPSAEARQLGGLLIDMYQPEPAWARALSRLEAQFSPAPDANSARPGGESGAPAKRLVFLVRVFGGGSEHRARRQALHASLAQAKGAQRSGAEEPDQDEAAGLDPDDFDLDDDEGLDAELEAFLARSNEVLAPDDEAPPSWLQIEPRLQTRRGDGWTAGRAVALRTLAQDVAQLDYLTVEDKPVIARMTMTRSWQGIEYSFSARAALGLIGHPRVYWADDPQGAPVEVVLGRPCLRVERSELGARLRIEPTPSPAGIAVERDIDGRLVVVDFSQEQVNLQRALAELPPIPKEGEERLRATLSTLAVGMTVHSELGVDVSNSESLRIAAAEPRPVVVLQRADPGLRARVRV